MKLGMIKSYESNAMRYIADAAIENIASQFRPTSAFSIRLHLRQHFQLNSNSNCALR